MKHELEESCKLKYLEIQFAILLYRIAQLLKLT